MSFLRGVLAGLAIGYLTAPRSGKETRDKLTKQANDLQGQWEEGVAQVKSQIDSLTGKAEAKVDQYADKAENYANKAENKFDQYKNEAQSAYNKDHAKRAYNNKVDDATDSTKSGIDNVQEALKLN